MKQELSMTLSFVPSFIDVDLPCRDKKNDCKIKHEEAFEMDVTLTMNSCPNDKFDGKMEIAPALFTDRLEVDYEILCKCDCERHGVANSNVCSGNGTYECGICKCNTNR